METKTKRIPKDLRASLIAEYEQNPDQELSDPSYYIIKDKNGKLQVRRKRSPKKKEETSKSESDSTDVPLTEEQKEEAEKAKAPRKEKKEKTL